MKYAQVRIGNDNSWRINYDAREIECRTRLFRPIPVVHTIDSRVNTVMVFDQMESYPKFVGNAKLSYVHRRRFNLNRLRCTVQLSYARTTIHGIARPGTRVCVERPVTTQSALDVYIYMVMTFTFELCDKSPCNY